MLRRASNLNGPSAHKNDASRVIKGEEFLDQLSDYQFVNKALTQQIGNSPIYRIQQNRCLPLFYMKIKEDPSFETE
jgi:hypothetical protein